MFCVSDVNKIFDGLLKMLIAYWGLKKLADTAYSPTTWTDSKVLIKGNCWDTIVVFDTFQNKLENWAAYSLAYDFNPYLNEAKRTLRCANIVHDTCWGLWEFILSSVLFFLWSWVSDFLSEFFLGWVRKWRSEGVSQWV